MSRNLNRRRFLQTSAAAASAIAAPQFIPQSAFGANERIVAGFVGLGGQGRGNLNAFLGRGVAVAGLVDVDARHLAQAMKIAQDKGHKAEGFGDYRKMLERKDIDVVVITTPDHWHALPTIDACEAGKDVYCEKPLSLFITEGRKMVEAARRNNRIVQTGSQQRSADNFRRACELVRNGYIGKLQTVLVGIPGANHPGQLGPDSDPPAGLDYEMWLGPAPFRPYNEKRVHYNFRFWWDYSGGQMTNWGAHHIDIAHWGMGVDDSGPLEVTPQSVSFHPQKFHEVPESCRLVYKYPGGVTMILGQKESDVPQGTTFIGTEGRIFVNRGKLASDPPEILKSELKSSDVKLYDSRDHHRNFLECVASRELPICDVEIGHRSAVACHLGNIAARRGQTIHWDPAKEQITGDENLAAMAERPYRAPWKLPT
jgi:predicted dehydrogenase